MKKMAMAVVLVAVAAMGLVLFTSNVVAQPAFMPEMPPLPDLRKLSVSGGVGGGFSGLGGGDVCSGYNGTEPVPAQGNWLYSQKETITESSDLSSTKGAGKYYFLIGQTVSKTEVWWCTYDQLCCSVSYMAPVWIYKDKDMAEEETTATLTLYPKYPGNAFNQAWLSFCTGEGSEEDCSYIRLLYTPNAMKGDYQSVDYRWDPDSSTTSMQHIDGTVVLKRMK